MPRKNRLFCSTDTYHIVLRGINKQIIFEDRNDYISFLDTLNHYKSICKYEIFAYCLMNNHIHLLMRFNGDNLSVSLKRIADKYSIWYNKKYDRCGPLFQDRFKSEPVETSDYLFCALRYIIQNPLKAGLSTNCNYEWNCYRDYLSKKPVITDTEFIYSFFHEKEALIDFLNTNNNDYCMEDLSLKNNDDFALSILKQVSSCNSISDFQQLAIKTRNDYLFKLWKIGLSVRQMNRITGLSRYAISNILAEYETYY